MKKILVLLLSLFSIFSYAANGLNEAEVNKYIRQKLDRDKTITFTTKLNKANNTLEGYSEEGVLCAITSLDEQPDMIRLLQIKSTISEKKGYDDDGKLLIKATLVNGEFSGLVTQYNKDGSIEKTYDAKDFDFTNVLKITIF